MVRRNSGKRKEMKHILRLDWTMRVSAAESGIVIQSDAMLPSEPSTLPRPDLGRGVAVSPEVGYRPALLRIYSSPEGLRANQSAQQTNAASVLHRIRRQ